MYKLLQNSPTIKIAFAEGSQKSSECVENSLKIRFASHSLPQR